MAKSDPNLTKLDDDLIKALEYLRDQFEKEDSWIRKSQIKTWKKNDEFWHGIQYIFWSESKQDWISPVESRWFEQEEGREESEGPFYDFVLNIYRAHGDSIIAAMGSQVPAVRFPPDDADDADDVLTSKVYNKIVDLIQRHNHAKILLFRALQLLWTQGIVFAYHCPETDKKYGTSKIPRYKSALTCPNCQETKVSQEHLDENSIKPPADDDDDDDKIEDNDPTKKPEEDTTESGEEAQDGSSPLLGQGQETCPTCSSPLEKTTILDGYDEAAKSRVIVELFGGLEVKVPFYSKEQKDFGYLMWNKDQPLALLKAKYSHVADKIQQDDSEAAQYEKLARTPSSYSSYSRIDENWNQRTLTRIWFRPWQFEGLPDSMEKEKAKLKNLFTKGCYCAFIGKVYVEARDEDMDEYWTVGKSGVSQYIHADPYGQALIPVQEMTNVLANLTLETIEQGIPSTYADTEVLNFDVFSRSENRPGTVYPVKPKPGQRIADAFFEGGRATLSKEVPMFADRLDKLGQFLVGDFPSLFGGPGEGKSRTASEYSQSRQMALQRLTVAWAFFCEWWSQVQDKSVHMFVKNMIDDEHYTVPGIGKDDYKSVWIKRAELTGHVGEVEVEGAESFPVSLPQKQALFMKLIEMQNEFLNSAIFDITNRDKVRELLGFSDFNIPGEEQQVKQVREIQEMLTSRQFIPIDPDVDDDGIHVAVVTHWLADLGPDIKATDPEGYQFILLHKQMHTQHQEQVNMQNMQKQALMQQIGQPPPGGDENDPKKQEVTQ